MIYRVAINVHFSTQSDMFSFALGFRWLLLILRQSFSSHVSSVVDVGVFAALAAGSCSIYAYRLADSNCNWTQTLIYTSPSTHTYTKSDAQWTNNMSSFITARPQFREPSPSGSIRWCCRCRCCCCGRPIKQTLVATRATPSSSIIGLSVNLRPLANRHRHRQRHLRHLQQHQQLSRCLHLYLSHSCSNHPSLRRSLRPISLSIFPSVCIKWLAIRNLWLLHDLCDMNVSSLHSRSRAGQGVGSADPELQLESGQGVALWQRQWQRQRRICLPKPISDHLIVICLCICLR